MTSFHQVKSYHHRVTIPPLSIIIIVIMSPLSIIIVIVMLPPLPMYNPIIIPPLSSLCRSPSSLSCRLAKIQTIVVLGGGYRERRGHSAAKTEVGGRGRKSSDHRNYEKIRSKIWMIILWHSVQLRWKSVELCTKYTRGTQGELKQPIIRPWSDLCPPLPVPMISLFLVRVQALCWSTNISEKSHSSFTIICTSLLLIWA